MTARPLTRHDVELGLDAITTYLDQTVPSVERARAKRTALWQTGRDLGMTSVELGRLSGVKPVTVRKSTTGGEPMERER